MKWKNKNISLIGFMGSGKTTVGKLLASKISYSFIDMDNEIEKINNMSVSQIFEAYGEQYFRRQETDLITGLVTRGGQVISTGGGIVKNKINIDILKSNGTVIYLKADYDHICANLKNDNSRPILNVADKEEKIKTLLSEREESYNLYSDYSIEVSAKTPDKILNDILLLINS